MQPEPNEFSQKTSLNQNYHDSNPNSQYGFDGSDIQPPYQLRAGEGRPISRRSASIASSATSSSGSSEQSLEVSLRRLRKNSPVDRIAEHEKAFSYKAKRRGQGPSFTVVERGRNTTTGQVNFTDFPNEVLTHVLSHLPPSSLSEVSLVSRRFHQLVTTPHAWRIAFSRYFPGVEVLTTLESASDDTGRNDVLYSERRLFTRLTALASWRSEYILRTRLLNSLGRGKPADSSTLNGPGSSRSGTSNTGSAHVTYNSDLITTVDHLNASFGTGYGRNLPRFIHGATDTGMASLSDPRTGKVDTWGSADPFSAHHFVDVHPGDVPYGLGPGEVVGVPNSMDVSQIYGMVYAEGLPAGRAYYRSTEEKRGRILSSHFDLSAPELGIPSSSPTASLTSVWIAKTPTIPDLSEGLVGILLGSSQGMLSLYSLGTNPLQGRRVERGELIARWVLSPGVPIIAIAVDENYSSKRQSSKRSWVVALNALGEAFYLRGFPVRRFLDRALKLDDSSLERLAWETGRTVYWNLVLPTMRLSRPDPFKMSEVDGGYTPRTSWNGMNLSKDELTLQTTEVSNFLQMKPSHFRAVCEGWDMRRRLEVDFAADDENGAGESIVVISCALDEDQQACIKRYTRCMVKKFEDEPLASFGGLTDLNTQQTASPDEGVTKDHQLLFGGPGSTIAGQSTWSFQNHTPTRRSSEAHNDLAEVSEDWRTSTFLLEGLKSPQITTSAIDMSTFSLLTVDEDPLFCMAGSSTVSSPLSSPPSNLPRSNSPGDIPGQRARLFAVGTATGTIILWNVRAPTAGNATIEMNVKPIRIIYTDSPQISCLALTALYLVHGGNDGLVQTWDPLASNTGPIRTLNSRFSSRARRRLVQAEASTAGVGINLFAAGAICLDPDPTVLRGMVSLGSHLRYWSYSSQAVDMYKGNKRRLRRSERGSNQSGDRFSGTGRGALKEYIANEKLELEREKRIKRKEDNKLSARYGVDLLGPGATEDEILAYATLLSEEAAKVDEQRRRSASEGSSSDTITEEAVGSPVSSTKEEVDDDIAEAIRLSLQENDGFRASSLGDGDASASSFTVRYAKSKKSSPSRSPPREEASKEMMKTSIAEDTPIPPAEMDDLQFALQLSQAEEESRAEKASKGGKGKGRAS